MVNEKSSLDRWGLYPWFEEHGVELVHPDDLQAFRVLMPYGKVFERESEGEFLTLRYGERRYRVKRELFQPVSAPMYQFGQQVIIIETGDEARVDEIHWHFQLHDAMFFVSRAGRRQKKRFWAKDLRPAS